jgi:hypothetical protein
MEPAGTLNAEALSSNLGLFDLMRASNNLMFLAHLAELPLLATGAH